MGETSSKEKCFGYFSKYDDKSKDEVILRVMKEFGITKNTAQMYYYNWKKEYLNGDIKVVNRNPSAGCKHENKKPLTDEMIIDELTKYGFNYLTERTKLAKCIADKFKLEEHTAKFRIDELLKQRKFQEMDSMENVMKKVPEVKNDEKLTEDEINQLCENTQFDKGPTAVYEKPKPKKLLKIALLQGKTMSYEIQDNGFLLRQKSAVNAIPIDFKDIDDFIAELKELKEVIV